MTPALVRVESWAAYPWLRHGFSTRAGGHSIVYSKDGNDAELNLGFTSHDRHELVTRNRAAFLATIAADLVEPQAFPLATVRQVHGAEVAVIDQVSQAATEADGLITAEPGLLLGILTADCVPVLVADSRRRVVAALHAGRRGTAAGIVSRGVALLWESFGSAPEDLIAAIGPSIGPCCYEVGEALENRFPAELFTRAEGRLHLDLWRANRDQLLASGLSAAQITVISECTACTRVGDRPKYFSHRAEAGLTGRSMAVIGIAR